MKDLPQPEVPEGELMPNLMDWINSLGVPNIYEELEDDE